MYWTDWGSDPKIEKAAMDGSSRQSIVNGNLSWPNGLTIDKTTNLLYWADAKLDKIEVSDLNGGNRRLILSSSADVHPFGLTLYQGMLYWTDWNTKSISRFNLSNGDQETMITGLHQPMDIHLFDGSATDSGANLTSFFVILTIWFKIKIAFDLPLSISFLATSFTNSRPMII